MRLGRRLHNGDLQIEPEKPNTGAVDRRTDELATPHPSWRRAFDLIPK
jgi:hypothetical protein